MLEDKQEYFEIISCAFTEKKLSNPKKVRENAEKNYRWFKKQKIVPVLYTVLLQEGGFEKCSVFEKIKKEYKKSLFRQTLQESEIKIVKAYFDENEISYMVLKGENIRKLYPKADMRSSMDIDLIVKPIDFERARSILEKLGFLYDKQNNYHASLKKKPMVNIELHTQMCDSSLVLGFENKFNVWQRAKKKNENTFEHELSKEDLYIYMLAHFAQHMVSSGAGVRCVMDLYLLVLKYSSEFNNEYLTAQLELFSFSQLAYACFDAGKVIFGKNVAPSEKTEEFLDYIVENGYNGTNENVTTLRIIEAGGKKNEIKKQLFPSRNEMKKQFPILEKQGWMLWICYLLRGLKKITKFFVFSSRLKKINKTKTETINKTAELYTYLGLEVCKGESKK